MKPDNIERESKKSIGSLIHSRAAQAVYGLALSGLMAGCGAPDDAAGSQTYGKIAAPLSITEWFDVSGLINMRGYQCDWTAQLAHPDATCAVEPGFVLVGGGAEIMGEPQPGGLLTYSFPGDDLKTWYAGSKDHVYSSPHQLRAYAIGLRLRRANGTFVSEADLRQEIYRVQGAFAGPSSAPIASAPLSNNANYRSDDILIGGGAQTIAGGAGQLLTASVPAGNTWFAASKDHWISDPAYLVAFSIGIHHCPATWGSCFVGGRFTASNTISGGYEQTVRTIDKTYAMTSVGATVSYNGAGRLLTDLMPVFLPDTGGVAWSKDHVVSDSGGITTYVMGLKKQ
jgi:hypothetical protein